MSQDHKTVSFPTHMVQETAQSDPRVVTREQMLANVEAHEDPRTRAFLKALISGELDKPRPDTSPIIVHEVASASSAVDAKSAQEVPVAGQMEVAPPADAKSPHTDIKLDTAKMDAIEAAVAAAPVQFGQIAAAAEGAGSFLTWDQLLSTVGGAGDWLGIPSSEAVVPPFDRPYPADVVGRYLAVEDQFGRMYPPGMIVSLHPNRMIIGVVFFESMAVDEEKKTVRLGRDAFPTSNPQDYETLTSDRATAKATAASTTSTAAPAAPAAATPAGYRVHYLCQPWLKEHLYTGWFEDGPWQAQRIIRLKAADRLTASLSQLDAAKSADWSKRQWKLGEVPKEMRPFVGKGPLPSVAPSGRPLTHSFPLPYHILTTKEMAVAERMWLNHRFPTFKNLDQPRPTVDFPAAAKALQLPVPESE